LVGVTPLDFREPAADKEGGVAARLDRGRKMRRKAYEIEREQLASA
jgi:hypothetical protein